MNYNGEITNFPTEIVEKMLENQEIQGNQRNIRVFEENKSACRDNRGFTWGDTVNGHNFWNEIIDDWNFELFFEIYPKKKIEKTLPRVMITWNVNTIPKPRLVFAIKNGYYFTWANTANEEDAELVSTVYRFTNAKELFDEEI